MSVALATALDHVIGRALDEQRIVGTVVLVLRHGEVIYQQAAGLADREAGVPMQTGTVFRLASLTKPIVAATGMAMIERGMLSLNDAVAAWIPEFQPALADGSRPSITVRQLLNHTSGLSYRFHQPDGGPYHQADVSDGLDQPGLSMQENLKRIASVPLSFQPGAAWAYSVASDVLGEVVARASGDCLPDAVSRFVTQPLGMTDTGFAVRDATRLATPYADGALTPVRMAELHIVPPGYGRYSVRFAPARVFNTASFPSGGCGMVGTAADFAAFLEALRTKTSAMTANQTGALGPVPGVAFGFGLSVVTDPEAAQMPHSAGTFTWGGVYGHKWFVDPARGLTSIVLTNTAVEGSSGRFPMQIRDAIYRNP